MRGFRFMNLSRNENEDERVFRTFGKQRQAERSGSFSKTRIDRAKSVGWGLLSPKVWKESKKASVVFNLFAW